MKSMLTALAVASVIAMPATAQDFGSPALIAAAKKEGKLVYYTANFAEVEQEVIKAFNKRFPEIKVEMVRAPGGQLITRIKTEAAAGKLAADVVDHSDRALMSELVGLFQDYAPPNGNDYLPDSLISPKLWPRVTLVWSIAYNSALVKNRPKSWMDLTKPEYGNRHIGQVIAPSGGTTWTRVMFERQVLGEEVQQQGSLVAPDRLRFDFGPAEALTVEQIRRIEDLANAEILANDPVRHYETSKGHAAEPGAGRGHHPLPHPAGAVPGRGRAAVDRRLTPSLSDRIPAPVGAPTAAVIAS